MRDRLINRLDGCASAAAVLAHWCGVGHLELDVLNSSTTKSTGLRPTRTYKRVALLRTPAPSSRPVARVMAEVALDLLPTSVGVEVVRGERLLGEILIEAGARRRTVSARAHTGGDESGEATCIRTKATFYLRRKAVAMVTEDVYAWVVELPR